MKYISYLGGKIHETGPQIPLLYANCLHGRLCVADAFPDIGAGGNGLGRIGMATGNRAVERRADGGDSLCAVKKGRMRVLVLQSTVLCWLLGINHLAAMVSNASCWPIHLLGVVEVLVVGGVWGAVLLLEKPKEKPRS